MWRRTERIPSAVEVLSDGRRSDGGEDVVEKGSSGWLFPSVLLLVGVGFFLIGFLLVFLGSAGPPLSGGCFFWPFPVIVACGLGNSGGSFLLIGLLATVLTFLITVIGRWKWKAGKGSSAEPEDKTRESCSEYSRSPSPREYREKIPTRG